MVSVGTDDDASVDDTPEVDEQDVTSDAASAINAASARKHSQIGVEGPGDQITIEINHCLAYRKFAK